MNKRFYLTRYIEIPTELSKRDIDLIVESLNVNKRMMESYISARPSDTHKIWELDRLINNLLDLQLRQ